MLKPMSCQDGSGDPRKIRSLLKKREAVSRTKRPTLSQILCAEFQLFCFPLLPALVPSFSIYSPPHICCDLRKRRAGAARVKLSLAQRTMAPHVAYAAAAGSNADQVFSSWFVPSLSCLSWGRWGQAGAHRLRIVSAVVVIASSGGLRVVRQETS